MVLNQGNIAVFCIPESASHWVHMPTERECITLGKAKWKEKFKRKIVNGIRFQEISGNVKPEKGVLDLTTRTSLMQVARTIVLWSLEW